MGASTKPDFVFPFGPLGHTALLAKAGQTNRLDIGLDTFPSLVSISAVKEHYQNPPEAPKLKG